MFVNFLDTSAVLYGELKNNFEKTYISPITLMELENIKTNNKNEEVKYRAREAVRDIIGFNNIYIETPSQHAVEKILKKHSFLSDINDHHIICEASLLAKTTGYQVIFTTCDAAQSLFARRIGNLKVNYIDKNTNINKDVDYCGWGKYYPTEDEMVLLYSNPKMNVLNCKINEYAEIYQEKELKDILRWDGTTYKPLKYQEIKNKFLNETIRPKNLEQKMAFDLLQNQDIPVKLIPGAVGAGKDFLMLTHALDLVQRGVMNKIIFIRNLVPFKDAPEIGYLAGSLQDKIEWGMGPLASILGKEGLDVMCEQNMIEAVNLGFIRGMQWDNTIIYVSEGQNITGGGYKLLVSRCGKGSQLWINGDILQTDAKKFEENNGINRLIKSLSGEPLFGMVKLIKTERSATADLASKI